MVNIRALVFLFFTFFKTIKLVVSTGVIETRFIDFANEEGRRFDGKCCDDTSGGWWIKRSSTCTTPCDHTFDICLGNVTESSSMAACEFGKKKSEPVPENHIVFNGNIGNLPNPLQFRFNTWPGIVKLKVDVIDVDKEENSFDLVDHFEYQYSTDSLTKELDAPIKNLALSGSRSKFNVALKVFCDVNYYGKDCSVFCKPADDNTGHYTCDPQTGMRLCRYGWTGQDCLSDIDDCVGHRCYGGATCVDGVGFYTCVCPPGRTGIVCNAEINECASSPCKNGGTCSDQRDSFTCTCAQGWTGYLCEIPVLSCTPDFCLNGGTCYEHGGTAVCACQLGWTGLKCDNRGQQAACISSPCLNGSTCENLLDGNFRCVCSSGFTGRLCETDINECASEPCLNGGTCSNMVDDYGCTCPPGFTGANCEVHPKSHSPCTSNPCVNEGTCVSEDQETYSCECMEGYSGDNCENIDDEVIDPCNPNPCSNGGTCSPKGEEYLCKCMANFDGENCEKSKMTPKSTPREMSPIFSTTSTLMPTTRSPETTERETTSETSHETTERETTSETSHETTERETTSEISHETAMQDTPLSTRYTEISAGERADVSSTTISTTHTVLPSSTTTARSVYSPVKTFEMVYVRTFGPLKTTTHIIKTTPTTPASTIKLSPDTSTHNTTQATTMETTSPTASAEERGEKTSNRTTLELEDTTSRIISYDDTSTSVFTADITSPEESMDISGEQTRDPTVSSGVDMTTSITSGDVVDTTTSTSPSESGHTMSQQATDQGVLSGDGVFSGSSFGDEITDNTTSSTMRTETSGEQITDHIILSSGDVITSGFISRLVTDREEFSTYSSSGRVETSDQKIVDLYTSSGGDQTDKFSAIATSSTESVETSGAQADSISSGFTPGGVTGMDIITAKTTQRADIIESRSEYTRAQVVTRDDEKVTSGETTESNLFNVDITSPARRIESSGERTSDQGVSSGDGISSSMTVGDITVTEMFTSLATSPTESIEAEDKTVSSGDEITFSVTSGDATLVEGISTSPTDGEKTSEEQTTDKSTSGDDLLSSTTPTDRGVSDIFTAGMSLTERGDTNGEHVSTDDDETFSFISGDVTETEVLTSVAMSPAERTEASGDQRADQTTSSGDVMITETTSVLLNITEESRDILRTIDTFSGIYTAEEAGEASGDTMTTWVISGDMRTTVALSDGMKTTYVASDVMTTQVASGDMISREIVSGDIKMTEVTSGDIISKEIASGDIKMTEVTNSVVRSKELASSVTRSTEVGSGDLKMTTEESGDLSSTDVSSGDTISDVSSGSISATIITSSETMTTASGDVMTTVKLLNDSADVTLSISTEIITFSGDETKMATPQDTGPTVYGDTMFSVASAADGVTAQSRDTTPEATMADSIVSSGFTTMKLFSSDSLAETSTNIVTSSGDSATGKEHKTKLTHTAIDDETNDSFSTDTATTEVTFTQTTRTTKYDEAVVTSPLRDILKTVPTHRTAATFEVASGDELVTITSSGDAALTSLGEFATSTPGGATVMSSGALADASSDDVAVTSSGGFAYTSIGDAAFMSSSDFGVSSSGDVTIMLSSSDFEGTSSGDAKESSGQSFELASVSASTVTSKLTGEITVHSDESGSGRSSPEMSTTETDLTITHVVSSSSLETESLSSLCDPNPCLNNASCMAVAEYKVCICKEGFTGNKCEINVDECSSIPCQNGGKCIDIINDYNCLCAESFTGKSCEEKIQDESLTGGSGSGDTSIDISPSTISSLKPSCKPNPCLNNANCLKTETGVTCVCEKGFNGLYCEINVDDCKSSPCAHGGVCTDAINDYECLCTTGYTGKTCETKIPEEFTTITFVATETDQSSRLPVDAVRKITSLEDDTSGIAATEILASGDLEETNNSGDTLYTKETTGSGDLTKEMSGDVTTENTRSVTGVSDSGEILTETLASGVTASESGDIRITYGSGETDSSGLATMMTTLSDQTVKLDGTTTRQRVSFMTDVRVSGEVTVTEDGIRTKLGPGVRDITLLRGPGMTGSGDEMMEMITSGEITTHAAEARESGNLTMEQHTTDDTTAAESGDITSHVSGATMGDPTTMESGDITTFASGTASSGDTMKLIMTPGDMSTTEEEDVTTTYASGSTESGDMETEPVIRGDITLRDGASTSSYAAETIGSHYLLSKMDDAHDSTSESGGNTTSSYSSDLTRVGDVKVTTDALGGESGDMRSQMFVSGDITVTLDTPDAESDEFITKLLHSGDMTVTTGSLDADSEVHTTDITSSKSGNGDLGTDISSSGDTRATMDQQPDVSSGDLATDISSSGDTRTTMDRQPDVSSGDLATDISSSGDTRTTMDRQPDVSSGDLATDISSSGDTRTTIDRQPDVSSGDLATDISSSGDTRTTMDRQPDVSSGDLATDISSSGDTRTTMDRQPDVSSGDLATVISSSGDTRTTMDRQPDVSSGDLATDISSSGDTRTTMDRQPYVSSGDLATDISSSGDTRTTMDRQPYVSSGDLATDISSSGDIRRTMGRLSDITSRDLVTDISSSIDVATTKVYSTLETQTELTTSESSDLSNAISFLSEIGKTTKVISSMETQSEVTESGYGDLAIELSHSESILDTTKVYTTMRRQLEVTESGSGDLPIDMSQSENMLDATTVYTTMGRQSEVTESGSGDLPIDISQSDNNVDTTNVYTTMGRQSEVTESGSGDLPIDISQSDNNVDTTNVYITMGRLSELTSSGSGDVTDPSSSADTLVTAKSYSSLVTISNGSDDENKYTVGNISSREVITISTETHATSLPKFISESGNGDIATDSSSSGDDSIQTTKIHILTMTQSKVTDSESGDTETTVVLRNNNTDTTKSYTATIKQSDASESGSMDIAKSYTTTATQSETSESGSGDMVTSNLAADDTDNSKLYTPVVQYDASASRDLITSSLEVDDVDKSKLSTSHVTQYDISASGDLITTRLAVDDADSKQTYTTMLTQSDVSESGSEETLTNISLASDVIVTTRVHTTAMSEMKTREPESGGISTDTSLSDDVIDTMKPSTTIIIPNVSEIKKDDIGKYSSSDDDGITDKEKAYHVTQAEVSDMSSSGEGFTSDAMKAYSIDVSQSEISETAYDGITVDISSSGDITGKAKPYTTSVTEIKVTTPDSVYITPDISSSGDITDGAKLTTALETEINVTVPEGESIASSPGTVRASTLYTSNLMQSDVYDTTSQFMPSAAGDLIARDVLSSSGVTLKEDSRDGTIAPPAVHQDTSKITLLSFVGVTNDTITPANDSLVRISEEPSDANHLTSVKDLGLMTYTTSPTEKTSLLLDSNLNIEDATIALISHTDTTLLATPYTPKDNVIIRHDSVSGKVNGTILSAESQRLDISQSSLNDTDIDHEERFTDRYNITGHFDVTFAEEADVSSLLTPSVAVREGERDALTPATHLLTKEWEREEWERKIKMMVSVTGNTLRTERTTSEQDTDPSSILLETTELVEDTSTTKELKSETEFNWTRASMHDLLSQGVTRTSSEKSFNSTQKDGEYDLVSSESNTKTIAEDLNSFETTESPSLGTDMEKMLIWVYTVLPSSSPHQSSSSPESDTRLANHSDTTAQATLSNGVSNEVITSQETGTTLETATKEVNVSVTGPEFKMASNVVNRTSTFKPNMEYSTTTRTDTGKVEVVESGTLIAASTSTLEGQAAEMSTLKSVTSEENFGLFSAVTSWIYTTLSPLFTTSVVTEGESRNTTSTTQEQHLKTIRPSRLTKTIESTTETFTTSPMYKSTPQRVTSLSTKTTVNTMTKTPAPITGNSTYGLITKSTVKTVTASTPTAKSVSTTKHTVKYINTIKPTVGYFSTTKPPVKSISTTKPTVQYINATKPPVKSISSTKPTVQYVSTTKPTNKSAIKPSSTKPTPKLAVTPNTTVKTISVKPIFTNPSVITSTIQPATTKPTVKAVTTKPNVKPITTKPTIKPVTTKPTVKPPTLKSVTTTPTVTPVTTKPTVKAVTTKPTMKPVTTKPTVKLVTTKPTVKPVTTTPTVKPVTTKPTVKLVSTKPTVISVITKPPVNPVTTKPPVKSVTIKPTVKPATTKSPVKSVTIKPPVKPVTTKPPVKPATTKPPVKSVTIKPTVKPVTTKPPVKSVTIKPTVKPVTTKPTVKPVSVKSLATTTFTVKASTFEHTAKPTIKPPASTKPAVKLTTAKPTIKTTIPDKQTNKTIATIKTKPTVKTTWSPTTKKSSKTTAKVPSTKSPVSTTYIENETLINTIIATSPMYASATVESSISGTNIEYFNESTLQQEAYTDTSTAAEKSSFESTMITTSKDTKQIPVKTFITHENDSFDSTLNPNEKHSQQTISVPTSISIEEGSYGSTKKHDFNTEHIFTVPEFISREESSFGSTEKPHFTTEQTLPVQTSTRREENSYDITMTTEETSPTRIYIPAEKTSYESSRKSDSNIEKTSTIPTSFYSGNISYENTMQPNNTIKQAAVIQISISTENSSYESTLKPESISREIPVIQALIPTGKTSFESTVPTKKTYEATLKLLDDTSEEIFVMPTSILEENDSYETTKPTEKTSFVTTVPTEKTLFENTIPKGKTSYTTGSTIKLSDITTERTSFFPTSADAINGKSSHIETPVSSEQSVREEASVTYTEESRIITQKSFQHTTELPTTNILPPQISKFMISLSRGSDTSTYYSRIISTNIRRQSTTPFRFHFVTDRTIRTSSEKPTKPDNTTAMYPSVFDVTAELNVEKLQYADSSGHLTEPTGATKSSATTVGREYVATSALRVPPTMTPVWYATTKKKELGVEVLVPPGASLDLTTARPKSVTLTVYRAVENVFNVSSEAMRETLQQARAMLRTSLQKLANLWQQCVRGVVNVVYVPAKQGVEKIQSKLTIAYSSVRQVYDYGKTALRKTYNLVQSNLRQFYSNLNNYYQRYYSRFRNYVQGLFSWRPPNRIVYLTNNTGIGSSVNSSSSRVSEYTLIVRRPVQALPLSGSNTRGGNTAEDQHPGVRQTLGKRPGLQDGSSLPHYSAASEQSSGIPGLRGTSRPQMKGLASNEDLGYDRIARARPEDYEAKSENYLNLERSSTNSLRSLKRPADFQPGAAGSRALTSEAGTFAHSTLTETRQLDDGFRNARPNRRKIRSLANVSQRTVQKPGSDEQRKQKVNPVATSMRDVWSLLPSPWNRRHLQSPDQVKHTNTLEVLMGSKESIQDFQRENGGGVSRFKHRRKG